MTLSNQTEIIDDDIFKLMRDSDEGKDVVTMMIDSYDKKGLKRLEISLIQIIAGIQDEIESVRNVQHHNLRDSSLVPLEEKKNLFGAFRLKILEAITRKNAHGKKNN